MKRADLVAEAKGSIARGSKSFRFASTLFDHRTRERVWLLYAWCRACDDLADGQEMGHGMTRVADGADRLATIRARTADALAGKPTGDAAFDGLGVVAAEAGIDKGLTDDLIQGFALDAAEWRPETEADLLRYCYHVAGVVGIMMALVMRVPRNDAETLGRARDLGLAFQLANIARDLEEDDRAGRCYVPAMWLRELGVAPGRLFEPANRAALVTIADRLAARAVPLERSARAGAAALPFRSRWAVLAAAGIYGGIAREVVRRGPQAWDARVSTSRVAKLGWVLRAAMQAGALRFSRRPA